MVEVTCKQGRHSLRAVTNSEKRRTQIEPASCPLSLKGRPMVAGTCHQSGEGASTLSQRMDETTADFWTSSRRSWTERPKAKI